MVLNHQESTKKLLNDSERLIYISDLPIHDMNDFNIYIVILSKKYPDIANHHVGIWKFNGRIRTIHWS